MSMSASGPPPGDSVTGNAPAGTPPLASGKSPKWGADPVGRERELDAIRRLLDDARAGRSGTVLLVGEAGIGKSTLLEAARTMAAGFTCLTAGGVESESVLAHAGLLELLNPLRHLLDEVPAGQAGALRAALGWGAADAPMDPFLVGAATLSLLAAAGASGPVLVLVDDLHWLDRESACAIAFAARRLSADAVAFVLNARTGLNEDLVHGFRVLELRGLSPAEAAQLVAPGAAAHVTAQLAEATRGNPLALLEVSRQLTRAQRVGAAPLPDPLPVGDRLRVVYEPLLTGLTPAAWRAVLLLALERTSAAAHQDPALDEAVGRGVVVLGEQGYRMRHPLLRAAALHLATPSQRREAHRILAASLPAEAPARVWHLAEANAGPDDGLADELARVADGDRLRLGYAAASAALERSAVLTRDPATSALRLAAAADDALVAGDLDRTRVLVDRVLSGSTSDSARGRALLTWGVAEQYSGSVPLAADRLSAACAVLDGAPLVRALTELALARFRLDDFGGLAECAGRIEAAADLADPEQRLSAVFVGGVARALAGDFEAAMPMLAEVTTLALSEELRHDPRALLLMALAAGFSGSVGEVIARGASRVDDVRRRGAVGVLVPILTMIAAGHAWVGDHRRAYADAGEAAELAEHLGYAADASVAVELLAWQSAARGLHDDARRALDRARVLIDRAGTTGVAAHYAVTASFCALCRGDLAEVVALLETRIADGGSGEMGEPLGVAPLLVEAYVGLGRTDDAAALARRYAEVTPTSAPAQTTALVLRCLGLTGPDPQTARAAFEKALVAHDESSDPFEGARTRLLLGGRLRRDGQRSAAREQLRIAHDVFTRLELTHWADLAAAELAATGASARRRGDGTEEPLTSQETRVALLVAEGRSNKEVAAALFLSPKTIERHLGNVFRKRGFKSRSELARAYAPASAGL
jgi:DNA-binding CsgD family transcriptional regulator